MYAWLWHRLPGGRPTRALIMVALLAVVLAVLFLVVFPWVEPRLPFNDVTVNPAGVSPS